MDESYFDKVNKDILFIYSFEVKLYKWINLLMNMDTYNSYQTGGSMGDSEFQRLAQNISSNLQKISQNGKFHT